MEASTALKACYRIFLFFNNLISLSLIFCSIFEMSWWGKSKDPKPEEKKTEAAQIKDTIVEKLPSKDQLPESVQEAVNKTGRDGNVFDDITDG